MGLRQGLMKSAFGVWVELVGSCFHGRDQREELGSALVEDVHLGEHVGLWRGWRLDECTAN